MCTGTELLHIQGELSPIECLAFLWSLLLCICYLKTTLLTHQFLSVFYCSYLDFLGLVLDIVVTEYYNLFCFLNGDGKLKHFTIVHDAVTACLFYIE